jgi:uncharacterized protein YndB with AHSA1/START domain
MAGIETSVTIKRSVEDVFALISDAEKYPRWSTFLLEARRTAPGPISVGTTVRTVAVLLSRRIESEAVVTEFEPNRRYSWEIKSGPFPLRGSTTLEQTEGGTRVHATFEGEPSGFFKLAEPLIVGIAKRQFQSDIDNLKDLMEANAL